MELLLAPEMKIFSVIAGIVIVLLAFEICLVMIGLSSDIGIEGDADSADAGFDMTDIADIESDIGSLGLSGSELAMLDISPAREPVLPPRGFRKFLDLIGITRGPVLIWTASVATGISCLGFALQSLLGDAALPAGAALAVVTPPGVLIGGAITRWVSSLIPSVENYAVSEGAYRGQRGVLVEGDAATGRKALVRWTDRHGTMHRLMAEPLREGEVIPRGSDVIILRDREKNPRLIQI